MKPQAIEVIEPKDETHWLQLRAQDITSTESPALFDVSPYSTRFELFHRKRERLVVEIEENERMKWGRRLQDAIAFGLAEEHGWDVRRRTAYHRLPALSMGASYDYELGDEGLLEVKNVDSLAFRDGWVEHDNGEIEAPPAIELQLQHQFACDPTRKFGFIGALIGGNRPVLIKREPDPVIIEALKERVSNLWSAIDTGTEPKPDFSRDGAVIARLCGQSDKDKLFDARGSEHLLATAERYKAAGEEIKRLDEIRAAAKAELLMTMGDSAKMLGTGFTVSASMIAETVIKEHVRAGRRDFRINWAKGAKA